jgi:hypothetical protein
MAGGDHDIVEAPKTDHVLQSKRQAASATEENAIGERRKKYDCFFLG